MAEQTELEERVSTAFDFAEKAYKDSGKLFMTIDIQYVKKDGSPTNVVLVLGDNETLEKRFELMERLGMNMASYLCNRDIRGVKNVLTFSETWIAPEDKRYNRPSENPNKKEAVMCCISDGKNILTKSKEIKRFFGHNWIEVELGDLDGLIDTEKMKSIKSPLLDSFYNSYVKCVQNRIVLPKE